MEKNIDLLTKKIFDEGIGKANKEAEILINEATEKSEEIVKKAKDDAAKLLEDATKEAEKIKKNSLSEIKLGGQQAIGALKQQIQELLSDKIIADNVEKAFDDPAFIKDVILEVVKEWKGGDGVDLSLSDSLKSKIDNAFEKSLSKNIKNLDITFDKGIKAGFKVSQKGQIYQIVFSDEDFIEFFKPYLREKSRDILFN